MGAIHFSINQKLAEILTKELDIRIFVETGTYKGDTLYLVKNLFNELHSCELSPMLYENAKERFKNEPKIICYLGASPDIIKLVSENKKSQPMLYWLDAHWCSDEHTVGAESQCPLLEEIEAIGDLHPNSVVWIDDARYFMAPPPKPHESNGWPLYHQVHQALIRLAGETHRIIFADDTILFYPKHIEENILDYLKNYGTDWLVISHLARVDLPYYKSEANRLNMELQKVSDNYNLLIDSKWVKLGKILKLL